MVAFAHQARLPLTPGEIDPTYKTAIASDFALRSNSRHSSGNGLMKYIEYSPCRIHHGRRFHRECFKWI